MAYPEFDHKPALPVDLYFGGYLWKTILLNVSVHYFAFTHKRILELCPYSCIQSCLILLSCCVVFHTIAIALLMDISLFSVSHTVPHTTLQSTSLCIFMLLFLWDIYQEVEDQCLNERQGSIKRVIVYKDYSMPQDVEFHQRNENSAYEVLSNMELI